MNSLGGIFLFAVGMFACYLAEINRNPDFVSRLALKAFSYFQCAARLPTANADNWIHHMLMAASC